MNQRTFVTKSSHVLPIWHIVDAENQPLGRLASRIAIYLRGKHKPTYSPYMDVGDYIIVINADKVKVTRASERAEKVYYRYTGYPGGIKETPISTMLARHPERVIEGAVKRMLPRGPLGRRIFGKLKVYAGRNHPHSAQCPQPLSFKEKETVEKETHDG